MQTEAIINVSLVDVTAKQDSTPSITRNASFADTSLLKNELNNVNNYMTLEWNYSLLNGTMQHFPNNKNDAGYPVFSSDMSDGSGEYDNSYDFVADFTLPHSSAGISFSFQGDFPAEIDVEWYGQDNQLLAEKSFYPDQKDYFCEYKVENYYKVSASFIGSKTPYRFLKMQNVEYGYELIFTGAELIEAKILEEVDPISSELRINTLDFTVYDEDREFNILNQKGKYSLFQSRQEIRAREIVDGETIEMGTFYLESKESRSETEIAFHAIDGVGIIDKSDFIKGRIYQNEKVSVIVSEIMESAGWEKYEISSELQNLTLSGYIPICSHREALQQVAFAIRAIVDCSRTNLIRIYRQNTSADIKIKDDRLFIDGEKVSDKEYVSKIEITTHQYQETTEQSTIFDGILNAGLNEITFSEPAKDIVSSAGTVVESGVNYAIIRMSETGECTVTGKVYEDLQSTFIRSTEEINSNEVDQIISVSDATLVDKNNSYLLAENLFDYYSLRRILNARYVLGSERTGRWVSVKSYYGMYINGGIESQEINLAGGFLATATITGYNTLERDYIYTGTEAYTGEEIGVV